MEKTEKKAKTSNSSVATNKNTPPVVTVMGGGLAGLVAALELVSRGVSVELYESDGHLGGKAAALRNNLVLDGELKEVTEQSIKDMPSDHGYHVFPKWYYNMRELWKTIDLDPETDVFETGDYFKLLKGDDYIFEPPEKPSLTKMLCLLDLVSRSDDEVDDITCRAFFYSRIYNPQDSITLNDLFLNALSIAEYDIGARVARDLFRQWLPVFRQKNWDALRGDLSTVLIDRIVEKTKQRATENDCSVTYHLNHSLEEISVVRQTSRSPAKIKMRVMNNNTGKEKTVSGDNVVMAIPMDVLRKLQTDDLFEHEPAIGKLNYLRANQFSAIDIYFKDKLPNIPKDHFDLFESKYHLSALEISELWPNLINDDNVKGSVLQFVAGSCKTLLHLSEVKLVEALLEDIRQFIPDAKPENIDYIFVHRNEKLPLFVNDVGTWEKRPVAKGNLFAFAGDYTRHHVDITSMEGAVLSGLNAAEEMRQKLAPNTDKVHVVEQKVMPLDEIVSLRKRMEGLTMEMGILKREMEKIMQ